MRLLALWIGKLVYLCLRLFGRRGSALPGLVIGKIYPPFLIDSLSKIPEGVVIITGTNGKTTTTKMLTHILSVEKRVLSNPTGSNFIRGMTAAIIHCSKFNGKLPYDIAVFELDEAYAARFSEIYKPRGVVVTNVMRDQMDRFGEIDTTAKLIGKAVEAATEFVVLNRDDPRVFQLSKTSNKTVKYFGVSSKLRSVYINDDELHAKEVSSVTGASAAAELSDIFDDGSVEIKLNGQSFRLYLASQSSFNFQNATAACAAALLLETSVDIITSAITEVKPAFGRGEEILLGNSKIILQLVKNPGGFRHALHSLSTHSFSRCMIAINDDYADGRDVSWLWDVDFKFNALSKDIESVYTSGARAADMALRLKYDDINTTEIEPSLSKCLEKIISDCPPKCTIIIFTTYTAMLSLRKLIAKYSKVEKI